MIHNVSVVNETSKRKYPHSQKLVSSNTFRHIIYTNSFKKKIKERAIRNLHSTSGCTFNNRVSRKENKKYNETDKRN